MPTKRTRRTRSKHYDLSEAAWCFINDELTDEIRDRANQFELLDLEYSCFPHKELSELWNANRNSVLKRWMLNKPGTRPYCWWLLDAPPLPEDQKGKFAGTVWGNKMKEPRKRLSGTGTEVHRVLNIVQSYRYGIPGLWVSQRDVEYYNGRSRDIHGNLTNPKAKEGDFKGVAIDTNNPPIFESQAAYLERFGLLSAAEKKKSNFDLEPIINAIGATK